MNSTQMRNAIAKALGLDPSQIHVVDVDVAPEISEDGYFDFSATPTGRAATEELAAEMAKLDAMTGGYPPISDPKGTWWASQEEKERLAFENLNTPKAPLMNALNEIDALKQKLTYFQAMNSELATRNDRQAATINDLHEKIAGGEALADKKAMRKSLAEDISLAQALIGEIFDEHAALTNDETFPEDVLESINTELDLISQRLYNLGQYVNRAL